MLERVKNEPVLVLAFVEALLGLLLAFGVDLTTAQNTAILVFTGAVLAFAARRRVVPVRKL